MMQNREQQCDSIHSVELADRPQRSSCEVCCKSLLERCMHSKNIRLPIVLFLGQFLSVLLCSTGVTSQLLTSNYSISVPTTQAFINYSLLALVYGVLVAARSEFLTIIWKNWWKYIFLGFVDVEANYMIIMAYRYTNLTSVQLLDSFTIMMVMVLSFIFLRARYKIINFMGVSLSLIGVLSLVLADIQGSRAGRGSNPLLGDLLCLAGSVMYAIGNVAQEFLVKNHTITEYLGFIGISGSIISAIQLVILERKDVARIDWDLNIGFIFIGFGFSLFLFYSIMSHVMKLTSAVVVNLSLLTADFYTLIFGLFLFKYKFSFFYMLAFILIVTGIFIYNLRMPSTVRKNTRQKKEKEMKIQKHQSAKSQELIDGLRRALFESQTYEFSGSKNSHIPNLTPAKPGKTGLTSQPNGVNKVSGKPSDRPPTAGLANAKNRGVNVERSVLKEDVKESLIKGGRRSSNVSDAVSYGSMERQSTSPQRTTEEANSRSPDSNKIII